MAGRELIVVPARARTFGTTPRDLPGYFPIWNDPFRKITDYGIAFNNDSGLIGSRAENHNSEATDGQAGTILASIS